MLNLKPYQFTCSTKRQISWFPGDPNWFIRRGGVALTRGPEPIIAFVFITLGGDDDEMGVGWKTYLGEWQGLGDFFRTG